jgi:hypothetical protein
MLPSGFRGHPVGALWIHPYAGEQGDDNVSIHPTRDQMGRLAMILLTVSIPLSTEALPPCPKVGWPVESNGTVP